MSANPQVLRRAAELQYARLDGWFVDVAANRLQRGGRDVRLTPKSMAVLRELLANPGRVIKRDDLLGLVWRDGFPTDDVLTHAITELRRAIDDDPRAPRVIETIPRVGYRLIGSVEVCEAPRTASAVVPIRVVADGTPVPAEVPDSVPVAPVPAAAVAAGREYRVPALFALAALVLAIGFAVATRMGGENESTFASVPESSADGILRPEALTSEPTREQFPSLSPDGTRVAYIAVDMANAATAIRMKSLGAGAEPETLAWSRPGAFYNFPVWSPDGTRIAYQHVQDDRCAIEFMPISGGAPEPIAECWVRFVDYIDWTADGKGLLATRRSFDADGKVQASRIVTIDLADRKERWLDYSPRPMGEDDLQPRSSPDGRWIAFRRGAAPYSDLYLVPVGGGEARRLTSLRTRMRGFTWTSDSDALVFSSDHEGVQTLYRLELADGRVTRLGGQGAQFPSIARAAPILVYQEERQLTQLTEYRPSDTAGLGSEPMVVSPSTRSDYFPRLSPRGDRLAFVSERSGSQQLWLYDFERDQSSMLTRVDGVSLSFPNWAPDQTAVLFVARGTGGSALMRVEIATGAVAQVSRSDEHVRFGSYAGNGAWIYFSSDRSGEWQIWRMRPDGSEAEQLSKSGGFDPRDPLGDGALYYVKETDRGLFRLDLDSREERRVSSAVGYWNMDGYDVAADGVYVLDGEERGEDMWLARHAFKDSNYDDDASATSERLLRFTVSGSVTGAAFDPGAHRLVLSIVARDETDLMTALLPPAAAPLARR
jgi:Tol biopolymer transport system component/DNA-binding winged helix-turn-helix (wHTH) protein